MLLNAISLKSFSTTLVLSLIASPLPLLLSTPATAAPLEPPAPLSIAQYQTATSSSAEQLLKTGLGEQEAEQYSNAIQSFQKSASLYRQLKDKPGEAKALIALSKAYFKLESYSKALELAQQVQTLAQSLSDAELDVQANSIVGQVYLGEGNVEQGLKIMKAAIAKARTLQNPALEADSIEAIFENTCPGNLEQAELIPLLQRLAELSQTLNRPESAIRSFSLLGNIYRSQQQYSDAEAAFKQALTISQQGKNVELQVRTLMQMRSVSWAQGDYKSAFKYHEAAIAVMQADGQMDAVANLMSDLARDYELMGDRAQAAKVWQRLGTIAQQIGND